MRARVTPDQCMTSTIGTESERALSGDWAAAGWVWDAGGVRSRPVGRVPSVNDSLVWLDCEMTGLDLRADGRLRAADAHDLGSARRAGRGDDDGGRRGAGPHLHPRAVPRREPAATR